MDATQTYTIEGPCSARGVSMTGRTREIVRGFFVVDPNGRRCRAFRQGTAEKWTPALEARLRTQAQEWAAFCTKHFGA